jgi:hypothetical protein
MRLTFFPAASTEAGLKAMAPPTMAKAREAEAMSFPMDIFRTPLWVSYVLRVT